MAVTIRVGQCLGAGKPQEAMTAARIGFSIGGRYIYESIITCILTMYLSKNILDMLGFIRYFVYLDMLCFIR